MNAAPVVDTDRRPRRVIGRLMVALLVGGALVPLGMMDAAAADGPSLSIDDVTVQEPQAVGATSTKPPSESPTTAPAVFTVTLDQPAPAPVAVHFATAMSFPPNEIPDIQSTSGWLAIDAGEQTAQITVLVNRDFKYEPTEYFTVELDQPSGADIADGSGEGTILNSSRDGYFSCSATGFSYRSTYSGNYTAYGQANPDFRGSPRSCRPDHQYEAGAFDNGTAHAYVGAVPDYLHWGVFTVDGHTTTDPYKALELTIPQVGDAGLSTGSAVDGSVTTTSGFTLKFDGVRAEAAVRCAAVGADPPAPALVGTSRLRGLTLGKNSNAYYTDYVKKPFGIGGQIEFNKQTVTPLADGMRLTQQAIVISNSRGDTWVVGEAVVEYHRNPCRY